MDRRRLHQRGNGHGHCPAGAIPGPGRSASFLSGGRVRGAFLRLRHHCRLGLSGKISGGRLAGGQAFPLHRRPHHRSGETGGLGLCPGRDPRPGEHRLHDLRGHHFLHRRAHGQCRFGGGIPALGHPGPVGMPHGSCGSAAPAYRRHPHPQPGRDPGGPDPGQPGGGCGPPPPSPCGFFRGPGLCPAGGGRRKGCL